MMSNSLTTLLSLFSAVQDSLQDTDQKATGFVDPADALLYVYAAYGVTTILLLGLGVYVYTRMQAASRKASDLMQDQQ